MSEQTEPPEDQREAFIQSIRDWLDEEMARRAAQEQH